MRYSTCTFNILQLLLLVSVSHIPVHASELQAISVGFGPDFLGYDGAWSPAQIRVGSPEQYLLVFPSTTSSETWVAGPTLCDGTSTCASLRGGLFYTNNSTTWQSLGQYELGYSDLSQTAENGDYGFDNISMSDSISTSNQIIAVVDDINDWNGQLGLGVQETRFQNNTNYLPFISTLVQNNSVIPSHSYGYTAGASYQGRGVLGSLTLGGVDSSRFTSNNYWFDLGPGYIPSVAVRSVDLGASFAPPHWSSNPLPLMAQSAAATFAVDSSTPYLWLPESVCDNIAQALNLTWDSTINLYVVSNSTTPQDLVGWGMTFTFRLANDLSSSEMIALPISYGAFNLQLSYPFPGLFSEYSDAKVNYFPLRRANSSQQYTVGRAFLQETYLTVDYERNAFSLSQALFPDSSDQPELASITRPDNSTWPRPGKKKSSSGLSTGAKAGIAIGAVAIGMAITGLIWFFCVRKRRSINSIDDKKSQRTGLFSVFSKLSTRRSSAAMSAAELQADKRHPTEMVSDSSNSRFELSSFGPAEMAAGDVAPTFFAERTYARIPQRNDPRSPVELVEPQSRSSISKDDLDNNRHDRHRSSSPVPAYSPTDTNQRQSQTISPYSPRHNANPFQSSSDNAISPVTGTNSDKDRLSHSNHDQTGSDSSRFLSPVSPIHARNDGQSSSHSSIQSSNTNQAGSIGHQMQRSTLSPAIGSNVPRRSPSRDSRFREELMEDDRPQVSTRQPSPGGTRTSTGRPAAQSRFSWEG